MQHLHRGNKDVSDYMELWGTLHLGAEFESHSSGTKRCIIMVRKHRSRESSKPSIWEVHGSDPEKKAGQKFP